MFVYRFYVPEQHEAFVEQEILKTKKALDKTYAASTRAGLLITWEWSWVSDPSHHFRLGVLVLGFDWPAAKLLGRIPRVEEWDKAFKKEFKHLAGLEIRRLIEDGTEVVVLG